MFQDISYLFFFDYENKGYERLRKHFVHNTTDKQNYKSDKGVQVEMDIYSYLPSVFLEEKDTDDITNLGKM